MIKNILIVFVALNFMTFAHALETQEQIAVRVASKMHQSEQYRKVPIYVFHIESDFLPSSIQDKIGEVEKTKYSPEYFRLNPQVGLQFKVDGTPNFYFISTETYEKEYQRVDLQMPAQFNQEMYPSGLKTILSLGILEESITAEQKTTVVSMLKMSNLGYPIESQVVVASPWGGESTKLAGEEGWIVIDRKKDGREEYYLVNQNSTGQLPIGYIQVK